MKKWWTYTVPLTATAWAIWYFPSSDCEPWRIPLITLVVWTLSDAAIFASRCLFTSKGTQ